MPALAVCERTPGYRRHAGLRESELSRLWQAQRLPPEALTTTTGEELRVVYRGRRGAGPGPDFRDAVIGTGDAALQKGDVELHVRSSDFRRHGHHLDRAYLRLVLHVVFDHDGGPTELLDGRTVPVVALGRWVERRAGELRAVLADPLEYREPCHTAVARLGAERARTVLTDLGGTRLRERAARLAPSLKQMGPEQALYAAIARALGLTKNTGPFEAIAAVMPLAELHEIAAATAEPDLAVEAALLGTAGVLEGQLSFWHDAGDRHRALLAAWRSIGGISLRPDWASGPYRPGCAPADRLSGLAALVCREGPPLDATRDDWAELLRAGPRALLERLQVRPAIGRDRAIELAVNAVLPWLLAAFAHDEALSALVFTLCRELPAPPAYGRIATLASALVDGTGTTLVRGAAASQGALQMTHDWCTRGGCGHCPLS